MADDTCRTDGCARPIYVKSRGLCSRCWTLRPDAPQCVGEGCGRREQLRKGLCNRCRLRVKKRGHTGRFGRRFPGEAIAELRQAANSVTDECIIFAGHSVRPTVQLAGTLMFASRAAWILAHGDPGVLHVLHTCHRGDEGCINLNHLYLGDHQRNMTDKVEAGRSPDTHGEKNPRAKLTSDQVREIRRRHAAGGTTHGALALEFGVAKGTISCIMSGQNWGWLA